MFELVEMVLVIISVSYIRFNVKCMLIIIEGRVSGRIIWINSGMLDNL